jgi:DnaJ-class molecular chaperone
MPDHYEVLGVPRDAPTATIRTAYLKLARDQHPDRFTDPAAKRQAEEAFKTITTAFNTLTNDRARQEYNAQLERPLPKTPAEAAAQAFAQAQSRVEARDYVGAVELLRMAAHNAPSETRYHLALGRVLVRTPQGAREGIEALERAARLAPQDVETHLELARALLGQGLRLRAGRAAEAAQRLAPQNTSVRRLLEELGVGGSNPTPETRAGGVFDRLRRKP